jgi:Rrf2 family iron-sulfur cluster assembly transcriptional regulator
MKLTTKGRYAVTALLDLALIDENRPISLGEISQRQGISLSYLEQLFARLRRRKIVSSVRGPGGGYRLAKDPAYISVAEIISAVDELVDMSQCHGHGNCRAGEPCLTHTLWMDINQEIKQYLERITLADLVQKHDRLRLAG